MSLPTTFSGLAAGNYPASLLDGNYNAVGNMAIYRCTAAGTNAITLTPISNQTPLAAYANNLAFWFIAPSTTSGAVTAQVGALPFINVYNQDGTAAGTGNIVSGAAYVGYYISTLNSGAGGIQIDNTILNSVNSGSLTNLGSNIAIVGGQLVGMPNAKRSTGLTVTSSTTFADIPGFSWVLPVGIYDIKVFLRVDQLAAGGHKTQTLAVGGTISYYQQLTTTLNSAGTSFLSSSITGGAGAMDTSTTGTINAIDSKIFLSVTAPTTFSIQGAQSVSNATSTVFNGTAILTQVS